MLKGQPYIATCTQYVNVPGRGIRWQEGFHPPKVGIDTKLRELAGHIGTVTYEVEELYQ
jgi:hypothetical protein